MNRENYPQSKEDFDTRLHRAQENNEAQGRVGNPGSSESGKGLALRIGTELVFDGVRGRRDWVFVRHVAEYQAVAYNIVFIFGECGWSFEYFSINQ